MWLAEPVLGWVTWNKMKKAGKFPAFLDLAPFRFGIFG